MKASRRVGVGRMAGLGLVLLIAACVPKLHQPQVWLAGVRLSSLGLTGGVANVRLGIYNPNGFDLKADGVTYLLELQPPGTHEWVDFTKGRIDRDVKVPAGDSVEISVPVNFSYGTVGQAAQALLERGAFDYRVSGTVSVTGPIRRDLGFRHTGTVTESGVR